jgi:outer membrane protein OmpA-like peptidoglycan-associated protein
MKTFLNPGSIMAVLVTATLSLPAVAQSNTPQAPPQQNPQVQTGASTSPNTNTAQTQTQNSQQTATGQAPLPVKPHEGFWGHMNPFARKKWVNNELNPVKGRLNELDEIQAKNQQDIQDVDRRAQNGIHAAQSTANEANQTASTASQTAGQAQQLAQQANDTTTQLTQTVANLDQYHPVNNLDIRYYSGERMLNQRSRAALDQIVTQMQNQKGYVVEVQGYSRSRGMVGVENSQHMSEAVVRYLAEHQIPIWRIHEVAMGNAGDNGNVVRISLMENSLAGLNPGTNGGSPIGATQPNSAQPSPQGAASQPAVPQR